MIKKTIENISFFQSTKLACHPKIKHFFSTRNKGVSKGVFESLNFGTHHGEEINMKINLALLANELQLNIEKFIIPKQTHSDLIGIVNESNYASVFENTDALITNIPSLVLSIKTADCVPILLFDPDKNVVGAVHSGWKGTALNIVGKTVCAMTKTYGSDPGNIITALGPCIGFKSYEVGFDVIQKIRLAVNDNTSIPIFENTKPGKFFLDLTKTNIQLLLKSGIKDTNIDTSQLCTYSIKEDFYSARRDGSITGRMMNGICIMP